MFKRTSILKVAVLLFFLKILEHFNETKMTEPKENKKISITNFALITLNVMLAGLLIHLAEGQKPLVLPILIFAVAGIIETITVYINFVQKIQYINPSIYWISNLLLLLCILGQIILLIQSCNSNQFECPSPFFTSKPVTLTIAPDPTPVQQTLSMSLVNTNTNSPYFPKKNGTSLAFFASHIMCDRAGFSFEDVLLGSVSNLYEIQQTNDFNHIVDVDIVGAENSELPRRFLVRTNNADAVFLFTDKSPESDSVCYFWLLQPVTLGLLNPVSDLNDIALQLPRYDCQDIIKHEVCP